MSERSTKVLLIDDDPAVLHVMGMMLESCGFAVITASCGADGLRRFADTGPDLVICDMRMPEVDGSEVLRNLLHESPDTPVIAISGAGVLDDAVVALRLGAWDYLVKPVAEVSVLQHAIEKVLERARLRRENERYKTQLETANWELAASVDRLEKEITKHKRTLAELRASQQQLRALSLQLAVAEESERRRLAFDLHDHVGQMLAMMQLRLHMLRESSGEEETKRAVGALTEQLASVIADVRNLTFDLSPPALNEIGLGAALDQLANQIVSSHGVVAQAEEDPSPKPLGSSERAILFRAARELMLNVVKHAKARHMNVVVRRRGGRVLVEVSDDGVGFEPSVLKGDLPDGRKTFGLRSVHERLSTLGGDMKIESVPGKGTKVTLSAPLS